LRAKWEAMQSRVAQAGALPNPMISYSGMDMASGGDWLDTGEKRFMVQQEFPWFGKRGLREGIALKDADIMRFELESMTQDVVMMVKETYYELFAVQRAAAMVREEEAVVLRMEKIAETMYAAGERTQADLIKAQAEITMLKQKLLELEAQEQALMARLSALLNRPLDSPLGQLTPPPEPVAAGNFSPLSSIAVTNRPEVLGVSAQVERYELEKKLMTKESLPDWKVGLEYRQIGMADDMVMFTLSVDLPIWRAKYRAGVREAERMCVSSEEALEAAKRQSALDL